jgi:type II secretory pathway pseudopilin PulG
MASLQRASVQRHPGVRAGRRGRRRPDRAGSGAGAFTLIEMLFVIAVIFLLITLLLVGFRHARAVARRTADRAMLTALKQGADHFNQEVGFLPPLVKDYDWPYSPSGRPVVTVGGRNRVNVFNVGNTQPGGDLEALRTRPAASQPDLRFSLYTVPYYLLGVCEMPLDPGNSTGPPIDGIAGPGMRTPMRDGRFEQSGREFAPFFDTSRNARAVVTADPLYGRVELRDSHGVAVRYYRWEHGKPVANANGTPGPVGSVVGVDDLNIPFFMGDPSSDTSIRDAKYALMAAGPNGLFGNEDQLPVGHPQRLTLADMASRIGFRGDWSTPEGQARLRQEAIADNVVEVGR